MSSENEPRKDNTAIIVAIIGLISAVLVAIIGGVFLWLSKGGVPPNAQATSTTTMTPPLLEYTKLSSSLKLPLTIPCVELCMSNLKVVLVNVEGNNVDKNTTFKFSFTNEEAKNCNMKVKELALTDNSRTYTANGQIITTPVILIPGEEFPAMVTFNLVPTDLNFYQLHMVLACNASEIMIYQVQVLQFQTIPTGITPELNP